jgi:hypothetical protein
MDFKTFVGTTDLSNSLTHPHLEKRLGPAFLTLHLSGLSAEPVDS